MFPPVAIYICYQIFVQKLEYNFYSQAILNQIGIQEKSVRRANKRERELHIGISIQISVSLWYMCISFSKRGKGIDFQTSAGEV